MTRTKDIDLKHEVIEYLEKQASRYKSFPKEFTPTRIGKDIDAYIPRIGYVADEVIKELQSRGIPIEYIKEGNKRKFVIFSGKT
jgi:hypothetical protein